MTLIWVFLRKLFPIVLMNPLSTFIMTHNLWVIKMSTYAVPHFSHAKIGNLFIGMISIKIVSHLNLDRLLSTGCFSISKKTDVDYIKTNKFIPYSMGHTVWAILYGPYCKSKWYSPSTAAQASSWNLSRFTSRNPKLFLGSFFTIGLLVIFVHSIVLISSVMDKIYV